METTRNGSGAIIRIANGARDIVVRVMEKGGGRVNYFRVGVDGKQALDIAGKASSDPEKYILKFH